MQLQMENVNLAEKSKQKTTSNTKAIEDSIKKTQDEQLNYIRSKVKEKVWKAF